MLPQAPSISLEDVFIQRSKRRRFEAPVVTQLSSWVGERSRQPSKHSDPEKEAAEYDPVSHSNAQYGGNADPITEAATVCFGMVVGLTLNAVPHLVSHRDTILSPVYVEPGGTVHHSFDQSKVGTLEAHAAEMISRIASDGELVLVMSCSLPTNGNTSRRRRAIGSLDAILYGPKGRADDVGDFVEKCGYYLQEPSGCDRNVPYCNPQCLSSLDEPLPMTFDLRKQICHTVHDFVGETNNVLSDFETTEILAESQTPSALYTELQVHQRQALTFLQRREKIGQAVWRKEVDEGGNSLYINSINGHESSEPPPAWSGGILADEMGLGKTLSMIALVASDKDANLVRTQEDALSTPLPKISASWSMRQRNGDPLR
ncbi:MAG: hypothetical protein M1820_002950 [Bogoriella megaspora]|nr:MAG: hypothetical protein M1820_002950 [Bogoriella megaspora]